MPFLAGHDEWNPPKPPNFDDSTSTPFSQIRCGAIFSTVTGWRGLKANNGHCYSYDDGSEAVFENEAECWNIIIGGWPPRSGKCSP